MVASTVSCLMEWYSRVVFEERKNIAIAEDNIKDDFSCKVQGLLYHLIRVCMLHTYVYRLLQDFNTSICWQQYIS